MAGAGWHDFVPGEVLTAANVQDYLQDQTVMKFASAAARAAALPSPSQGMMSFLNDTGVVETYYAAWNATTNPGGKTAGAGWYATDRNDGLVAIVPPTVNFSGGSATANSLGTVSFTAVTGLSLNNVFTSAYSNYRVVYNAKSSVSGGTNILFRFRTSGTDVSAGYYGVTIYATSTQGVMAGDQRNNGGDSFYGGFNTANGVSITSEILPEAGSSKIFNNISLSYLSGLQIGSYTTATGTRPDGFTIYPVSGNMTGTIQVFGYNS